MSICKTSFSSPRARSRIRALLLVTVIAICSISRESHASPDYPGLIADDLNMPCPPPCTICHRDTLGGLGTVIQPFGKAMMAAGLRFFAPDTVQPALTKLETNHTDSDGDGDDDVLELSSGRDPNGDLDLCGGSPRFGCGARVAPRAPDRGLGLLAALLIGVLLGVAAHRSSARRERRAQRRNNL